MSLQQVSNHMELIQGALDEVEYRLSTLMLYAQSGEYRFLERASRDVARASAVLVQLEIERMDVFSNVTPSGSSHATLSDLSRSAGEPWKTLFEEKSLILKQKLETITELQQKVRAVCLEKIEVIDSTLTLLGGNGSVYNSAGHKDALRSSILSESA